MKTIYHPTLPGVSREVPEKDAAAWKEQGWRFTEPDLPEQDEAVAAPQLSEPRPKKVDSTD